MHWTEQLLEEGHQSHQVAGAVEACSDCQVTRDGRAWAVGYHSRNSTELGCATVEEVARFWQ